MAAGLWSLFIACMYNMFCCLIQYWRGSGEVLCDGDYQRKESIGGKSRVAFAKLAPGELRSPHRTEEGLVDFRVKCYEKKGTRLISQTLNLLLVASHLLL